MVPHNMLAKQGSALETDHHSALGSSFALNLPVIATSFGYQKCGTTFISDVLRLHPHVLGNAAKELHYLAGPEASVECKKQGPASNFSEFFDDCFGGQRPMAGQVALDFTPTYGTIQFVTSFNSSVKLLNESEAVLRYIAVLREPAARAVSAVGMKRKNNEGDYGNKTDAELDDVLFTKLRLREAHDDGSGSRFITDGEYSTPLAMWLESHPRDSMLVLNNEKLSMVQTWKRIFQHLGLSVPSNSRIREMIEATKEAYQSKQSEKYKQSQTQPYKASAWLMELLRKHYEPHNQQLWKLLGTGNW
eukprot:CAMPEP_0170593296 /NCGR_PEP_ID=MMETSP0224-20130122/13372_1 /TAXON_ID=285029 /ORGANISM="Togula jolla, Strain CCCM 725" /LENGTH=303 /DNA_ID=CAMNT_0010917239 /DNA_START=119 /DNA_END=1027 /DNA_ORIENTATION=-